ncbi:MAG: DUF938 domain-containing protein [Gammaproteobacteria bacterium]
MKPFSEACEQNKEPILEVLKTELAASRRVLEIGSGTGQHAVHFARHLPHLRWQTSDLPDGHEGIRAWLSEAGLGNVDPPLALDVAHGAWPAAHYDAVFTANTTHIMGWQEVQALFAGLNGVLEAGGLFVLYGPVNYEGRYTSASNARFDQWLKARDPRSAIRDFEAMDALATAAGMRLSADYAMPANNHLLVWRRGA